MPVPIVRWAVLGLSLSVLPLASACNQSTATTTEAVVVPVEVETVETVEKPMPQSLALTGTLRGDRETDLAANASGRVLETLVERGTEVKKGDLLARLDVRSASLGAAEARASAALASAQQAAAKRECERYEDLFAQGAIAKAELDRVSDQCKTSPLSRAAAEARASAAAQVVGDGTIRAPFGGVVTERFVDAGEFVRHDTRVVTLVAVDTLRLQLTVPEASLTAVKEGGELVFTVTAYPGRSFAGVVRFVGASVRETTRDLVAEAVVDNADRALRPGMFAAIELATADVKLPVAPKSAIVMKAGRTHVYAVVDRRVEERVVQVGTERDGLVAIVRGAAVGDRLVVNPDAKLQNGQPVE